MEGAGGHAVATAAGHAAAAGHGGGHDLATQLHHFWAWLVHTIFPFTGPHGKLEGFDWVIVSWLVVFLLGYLAYRGTRRMSLYPRGLQNVMEMIYEWLDEFVCGIMGPVGKEYIPVVGTAFVYVFCLNAIGLIPGLLSPTANLHCTVGLAVSIVAYVHYMAIAETGFVAWFRHLMDIDNVPLAMTPLMFCIHSIGEFLAKPLSLACRLFGNIYGEDQVIINLTALGITIFQHTWLPIPLQLPLMIFGIFTSLVQALVFSMLTAIYLAAFLSHAGDHHGEHGDVHHHGTHPEPGQAFGKVQPAGPSTATAGHGHH
jgi:F-type H+-transporting ATPase subunit a